MLSKINVFECYRVSIYKNKPPKFFKRGGGGGRAGPGSAFGLGPQYLFLLVKGDLMGTVRRMRPKNRGPVSQQVQRDKDHTLLKDWKSPAFCSLSPTIVRYPFEQYILDVKQQNK